MGAVIWSPETSYDGITFVSGFYYDEVMKYSYMNTRRVEYKGILLLLPTRTRIIVLMYL
jgi:hypothetical protein